jgi:hypothetical protein
VIRRFVAAGILLVLAAFLVLLTHDAWRWDRAIADADARAAVQPVDPEVWNAQGVLPRGLARRLLGLDDDVEFRQTTVRALRLDSGRRSTGAPAERAIVMAALGRIATDGSDRSRASRAADMLGVMLYTQPTSPRANPYSQSGSGAAVQTPEQKARAEFERAILLDPGNANAKRNLETLLRQPRPPKQQGNNKPGSGERIGTKGSGARPGGRGY